jgi:hypothetical protein
MKAAVVRAFKEPLIIEDRPIPEPGDGQVLVKIEASGLCHTDMHAANGDWPVKPTPPFVPGHEGGASSSAPVAASPGSAKATGSRSRGWDGPAASASTA